MTIIKMIDLLTNQHHGNFRHLNFKSSFKMTKNKVHDSFQSVQMTKSKKNRKNSYFAYLQVHMNYTNVFSEPLRYVLHVIEIYIDSHLATFFNLPSTTHIRLKERLHIK